MPTLAWNKETWDGDHSWNTGGEEWSAHWGSSEAQWFGSILPRIHRFFPCRRILEIAPGTGRWTRFLSAGCEEYVGIDLSAECVEACKRRFEGVAHAAFYQNDGLSLEAAGKGPFNLIFSLDSLVHADADVMEA